ncbi:PiggyBac transposable element-derived protein 4 [Plakobranchus ocellatus]|uniref:PiggyBac transposable element-derived protein 4 n=1 Tax=Plakobranchus ocellatus TaxID=259542 RepID=A0AAV3Z8R1_9GAST|nr:PiggyBac transposable element-derived protein 4 [Plakobranchus ocellatus]
MAIQGCDKRTIRPPKRYRTEEVFDFLEESDCEIEDIADSSDSYETKSESSVGESSTPTPNATPTAQQSTSGQARRLPSPAPLLPSDWCAAEPGFETASHFRFLPVRPSCVTPGVLPDNCSELEAFFAVFMDEIIDSLVEAINSYPERVCQMNNPPRARSRFSDWYPVTRAEMFKFFAVATLIGLEPRPRIANYWSRNPFHYSLVHHQLFHRE